MRHRGVVSGLRDRPAKASRVKGRGRPVISSEMISAGVMALRGLCPFDVAFPIGGEDEAVEEVLKAALAVQCRS